MRVRALQKEDFKAVVRIYLQAFAGFPWFEPQNEAAVSAKLLPLFSNPGFAGLMVVVNGQEVAVHWHDVLSLGQLRKERGDDLAQWVVDHGYSDRLIVWEREFIVHPDFQRRGLGVMLRREFLLQLNRYRTLLLVLTRLRADNPGTIKSAEKIGMFDTGVTTPATRLGEWRHYWALPVG